MNLEKKKQKINGNFILDMFYRSWQRSANYNCEFKSLEINWFDFLRLPKEKTWSQYVTLSII